MSLNLSNNIGCIFQIIINGKHPLVMKNKDRKVANQKW